MSRNVNINKQLPPSMGWGEGAVTGKQKAVGPAPGLGSCSLSGALTMPSTGPYPEEMLQRVSCWTEITGE